MAIKPTAAEVIAKGQLQRCYFPSIGDPVEGVDPLETHVGTEINLIDAIVQRRLGSVYTGADASLVLILHEAEVCLVLEKLWTQILSMMIGFVGSELPREFIEPSEAERLRDYYGAEGEKIIASNEAIPSADSDTVFAAPTFAAGGAEAESDDVVKLWYEGEME